MVCYNSFTISMSIAALINTLSLYALFAKIQKKFLFLSRKLMKLWDAHKRKWYDGNVWWLLSFMPHLLGAVAKCSLNDCDYCWCCCLLRLAFAITIILYVIWRLLSFFPFFFLCAPIIRCTSCLWALMISFGDRYTFWWFSIDDFEFKVFTECQNSEDVTTIWVNNVQFGYC